MRSPVYLLGIYFRKNPYALKVACEVYVELMRLDVLVMLLIKDNGPSNTSHREQGEIGVKRADRVMQWKIKVLK
jgi:hypothetical protein